MLTRQQCCWPHLLVMSFVDLTSCLSWQCEQRATGHLFMSACVTIRVVNLVHALAFHTLYNRAIPGNELILCRITTTPTTQPRSPPVRHGAWQ